jgi:hypothetical protein
VWIFEEAAIAAARLGGAALVLRTSGSEWGSCLFLSVEFSLFCRATRDEDITEVPLDEETLSETFLLKRDMSSSIRREVSVSIYFLTK